MSMQPHVTLVGAVLALTVLGCRNEHHYDYDETTPPTPVTTEQAPPLIEDEDEVEGVDVAGDDQEDRNDDGEASPPDSIDPGVDPKDQQVPEAAEPGMDPKQAPPPSSGKTKHASRG
jgi:hypothetical protein